ATMVLAPQAVSAAVPAALVVATLKATVLMATGQGVANGLISTKVAVLTKGGLQAMLLEKLKLPVALFLVFVIVGSSAGWLALTTLSRGDSAPVFRAGTDRHVVQNLGEEEPNADTETPNFRVEAPTLEIARRIARAAERCRKDKAIEWLGHQLPNWPQPC